MLTEGTLLGGRVSYLQTADGFRTGLEPVLLAATIQARPGDRVVEAGTGAGAGLLCLDARVPGILGLGLEIDESQAAVAARNFSGSLAVRVQDVTTWQADAAYDHAFANPPWHPAAGTPSPNESRTLAKMAPATLLAAWAARLAASLRRRGTLSLILPAASTSAGTQALLQAGCGEISLMPLWRRAGAPARLVILRGVRHGNGPDRVLPGLILHEPDGAFTPAANSVLRDGAGL